MVFCSLSLEFTISFIRIQKERKHLSGLSYKNESILFGSSTIFVERGTFLQNLSETLLFYIKEAPDFFYHFAALKNGAMIEKIGDLLSLNRIKKVSLRPKKGGKGDGHKSRKKKILMCSLASFRFASLLVMLRSFTTFRMTPCEC